MTLVPYPSLELRRYKVWKHVFDHHERWWEIYGSLPEWGRDWNALRGLGCDRTELGAGRAKGEPKAAPLLAAHHEQWFAAACRAVEQALVTGSVYTTDRPDVRCHVGPLGVTVYVARHGPSLVTCFRPLVLEARHRREDPSALAKALARTKSERAGVRRAVRGASYRAERS